MRSWPRSSGSRSSPSVAVASRPCRSAGSRPRPATTKRSPSSPSRSPRHRRSRSSSSRPPRPPRTRPVPRPPPCATAGSRPPGPTATDRSTSIRHHQNVAVLSVAVLSRGPIQHGPRRPSSRQRKDIMTIANISDPSTLTGAPVHGSDGATLGKVEAVYLDNTTEAPEWVAVKSGLFGTHVSIVPLSRGSWDGTALTVPFDKDAIQAAPHHDPDTALSTQDEDDLYRHYGITDTQQSTTSQSTTSQSTTSQGRRD